MGLIRDLFMSWKVCSVVFAVWTTNVWMRVSCQIFKSNVSSESSKPVWVGGTWWRSTQNSERNRSGQGSPHFSQPFFVPPDLWCTGLVCFLFFVVSFFSMSIRVALRNLWSRRPLWLIACTDHQGASFHFSPLSDSKCSVAILGNAEITSFPKIPTMLDTLRDCWWKKSGQHHLGCIIPVESIMAINYFASWPDFWSIRRITKNFLKDLHKIQSNYFWNFFKLAQLPNPPEFSTNDFWRLEIQLYGQRVLLDVLDRRNVGKMEKSQVWSGNDDFPSASSLIFAGKIPSQEKVGRWLILFLDIINGSVSSTSQQKICAKPRVNRVNNPNIIGGEKMYTSQN